MSAPFQSPALADPAEPPPGAAAERVTVHPPQSNLLPGAQQHHESVLLYLIGTLGLVLLYLATALCESDQFSSWANTGLPIAYGLLCMGTALRMLARQPLMIWSPFTWFLGANILYFSLGVLVLKFGSEASIQEVNRFYEVREGDLLRTNMLNCLGALGVAAGLLLGERLFPARARQQASAGIGFKLKAALVLVIFASLSVKYLIVLPNNFGLTNYTLPGMFMSLEKLTKFSLIVLIILAYRDDARWKAVLFPLMGAEILTAVLGFAKQDLIETMICILLGYFMLWPTKRMMVGGAALLFAAYLLSVNLVRYGRGEIISETGTHYEAGLEKRFKIVATYIKQDSAEFQGETKQSWWTRLCYSNAQAFAMDQYDGGHPGDSFSLAWYVLIPRVLWPEKPLITVGSQFNYLATGNPYSQSAPGFFAEAYWNGGWLYVLGAAVFVGFLFSLYTKHALEKIGALNLVYLPCALIGMAIGYRPDDWFVASVIGGTASGVLLYLGLNFLTRTHTRRFVYPGLTERQ